jgi:1-acyl-sn-glycerol-3-phosphate acyltransferase
MSNGEYESASNQELPQWEYDPASDIGMPPRKRLESIQRESGLISTGFHFAWWTMVRSYLGVWHRLAISGQKHIPAKPPFILIANHASHLDALVLAAPLPWRQRDRIFPIAAGDVFFTSPVKSAFSAVMLNALPMWRKNCGPHAMKELRRRLLDEPCSYILFPEGARSRDGNMLPFKPGLGMLVAETSVPVVPCHLDGCIDALHADQIVPRRCRIRLRIGEPINFADVPNKRHGWERIATTLAERVKALAPVKG